MCQTIHSVPRFHAALFRPCRRRWAILLSLDTKLFGEPQRQQLPTACSAPPINLHNFTRSSRFCTHVPLARTRLFCPVRSSALSQQHSRACCRTPVLAALLHSHVPLARTRLSCPVRSSALLQLHSRASRTHKALLPCTLPCALSCTSRARCTHRLSCLVRFLALAC